MLIAFRSAESGKDCELGQVIRWISKLWLVRLNSGRSCYVAPYQVEWIYGI